MFGAFLLSIAAGYASPFARPFIEQTIEKVLLDKVDFEETQALTLSFIVCMLAASILIVLFQVNAAPFLVIFGGAIGFFGKQIAGVVMTQVNK